jgi:fatty-acid desaturase
MRHVRVLKYGSVALLAGVVVLGHGIVLYRLFSHTAHRIVLGLILLVLLKHLGVIGPAFAWFKRRYHKHP